MGKEKPLPGWIYEDLLFQRRLERHLRLAQERLNAVLSEQINLLEQRKALLDDVVQLVRERSRAEGITGEDSDSNEENPYGEH